MIGNRYGVEYFVALYSTQFKPIQISNLSCSVHLAYSTLAADGEFLPLSSKRK